MEPFRPRLVALTLAAALLVSTAAAVPPPAPVVVDPCWILSQTMASRMQQRLLSQAERAVRDAAEFQAAAACERSTLAELRGRTAGMAVHVVAHPAHPRWLLVDYLPVEPSLEQRAELEHAALRFDPATGSWYRRVAAESCGGTCWLALERAESRAR